VASVRIRRQVKEPPITAVLTPHRVVEVPDGLGAIELVEERENAFRLLLGGDTVATDADAHRGSLMWIASRVLHPRALAEHHRLNSWVEPPAWDRLRQWLRHVEPGDDPIGPLSPLLDLLAPGTYALSVQALPGPFITATRQGQNSVWYAGMEGKGEASAIVPTHHWALRDSTVARYRRLIEYERRSPAAIVLTHPDSEVYYLLDGHHKTAAYMAAGRDPVAVVIEVGPGPRPDYLAYLDTPSLEYTVEENESGTGVLSVYGRDGASALRIGERPAALVEGYVGSGTLDRLAVRSGDARLRRDVRRLREWLRWPDARSAAAMTRALWGLLAPGRYGIRRWVPERSYVMPTGDQRVKSWYLGITTPDLGTALVPTDRWPDADEASVRQYGRQLAWGERPLVVTLRASPPEDEQDAAAFVIDGHHKLRAYTAADVAPHCLDIAKISQERACSPEDLRKVVGDAPDLQAYTSHLLSHLDNPR
jgi:hypothetical protein